MSTIAPPATPVPSHRFRLGTQGWNYDAWTGGFYPTGTRPADFLTVYARAFDTVEVDSTFYAVPAAKTVQGWAARTPEGFRFTLKLPQEITHTRRLREGGEVLETFCAHARLLGPKLGPVLVQLGPDFGPAELPALERFLPTLPTDLAFAVEFRDRAWLADPERAAHVLDLLATHGVTPALSDGRWFPRRWMLRLAERLIASTGHAPRPAAAYVRWMGPDRALTDFSREQVDRTAEMDAWLPVLHDLARVMDVYVLASNYFAGHSPATVRALQQRLGLRAIDPALLGEQITLL